MTQSNFDYININSDSSEEEEENEFKDKFSVLAATNILDCNICLQTYYRIFIFSNVKHVLFNYVHVVLILFILFIIIKLVQYVSKMQFEIDLTIPAMKLQC